MATSPPQRQPRFIRITAATIWLVAGIAVGLWFVVQLQNILLMIALACILASSLYPAVLWLNRRKWPARLSILGFYLLFLLLAAGVTLLIGNMIAQQGQQFIQRLPVFLDSAQAFLQGLPFWREQESVLSFIIGNLDTVIRQAATFILSGLDYVAIVVQGVLGIVTILVFTFFLLLEPQHFEIALLRLVPSSSRQAVSDSLRKLASQIGAYVRGQLIVMIFVGTVSGLGLAMLGVPYAAVLGILAFLLEIVPIIGPLLTSVLAILIALGQEPMLALWTTLLFFVIQQVENYILYPAIIGHTTGLHPVWVLLSILVAGSVMGVLGVLIAVPLALTVQQVLEKTVLPKMEGA